MGVEGEGGFLRRGKGGRLEPFVQIVDLRVSLDFLLRVATSAIDQLNYPHFFSAWLRPAEGVHRGGINTEAGRGFSAVDHGGDEKVIGRIVGQACDFIRRAHIRLRFTIAIRVNVVYVLDRKSTRLNSSHVAIS